MDLFQIMCEGGCGNDLGPIITNILSLIRLFRLFIPLIIMVFTLAKVVNWIYCGKKNKKRVSKEELKKKIIRNIIIVIIIFISLTIIGLIVSFFKPEFDDHLQCWCK